MISLLLIVGLFGVSHGAIVNATSNTIVYGNDGTDLSKCLVCNTAVALPVPKCGMDSNTLAAMQLKADTLAKDIAALEASQCCTGGVAAIQTNYTIGHNTESRTKPGDGKSWKDHIAVNVVHPFKGTGNQCMYSLSTYIMDNGLPRMGQDVDIIVLYAGAGTGDVCPRLQERCRVTIPASQFPTITASQAINVTFTDAQRAACKPQGGDFFGWRFISGETKGSFFPYTVLTEKPINYCFKTTGPYFSDTDMNRSNRLYSSQIYAGPC